MHRGSPSADALRLTGREPDAEVHQIRGFNLLQLPCQMLSTQLLANLDSNMTAWPPTQGMRLSSLISRFRFFWLSISIPLLTVIRVDMQAMVVLRSLMAQNHAWTHLHLYPRALLKKRAHGLCRESGHFHSREEHQDTRYGVARRAESELTSRKSRQRRGGRPGR